MKKKKMAKYNKLSIMSLLLALGVGFAMWVSLTPGPGEAEAKQLLEKIYTARPGELDGHTWDELALLAAENYEGLITEELAATSGWQTRYGWHYAREATIFGLTINPAKIELKKDQSGENTIKFLYIATIEVQRGAESWTVEEGGILVMVNTAGGWRANYIKANKNVLAELFGDELKA